MSIKVESTTDVKEPVKPEAANTEQKDAAVKDESASALAADETAEESDTSDESKEGEELLAKDEQEDTEDSAEKESEDRPVKKSGFKKRIHKLNQKLSAQQQETEFWKAKALEQKPEKQEPVKAKVSSNDKPKEDQFETHAEYVEALTDWKVEQKLKSEKAEAEKSELQTQFQKQVKAHNERLQAFRETVDDFDEVIEDVAHVQIPVAVEDLILDSDLGPAVMYELAKDPEELERVCKLSPMRAAREIGKIEARIKASEKPETKEAKKTKAPPPIKPVGSSAASSVKKSIYDTNLSQREFEKLREEQLAKRA